MKKLTPELARLIRTARKAGLQIKEIAGAIGVHPNTVNQVLGTWTASKGKRVKTWK